jgi:hypothetical protein
MQRAASSASPVRDSALHGTGAQSPNSNDVEPNYTNTHQLEQLRLAHKETLRAIELQVIDDSPE